MAVSYDPGKGVLNGIRVLQYTDEKGDYAGKLLQGLGADVIMVEPPEGSPSRRIGPFANDEAGPENSLFHWHYNVGKRSIVLDLDRPGDRDTFKALADRADVVLESMQPGRMAELGLGYDDLKASNPGLIMASISPFGQTGPWRDLKSSDLVHLALGGEMNYTRYPPRLDGTFDTPPIAGQIWQSYHFSGDWTVHAILAALLFRMAGGKGQSIDTSIHQVMSASTELDYPFWVYSKQAFDPNTFGPRFSVTKEGRWSMDSPANDGTFGVGFDANIAVLKEAGMVDDLEDPKYQDKAYRARPEVMAHAGDLVDRMARRSSLEEMWHAGQKHGLLWAAIRKPEENLEDRHWAARATFGEVEHPEVGKTFRYPVSRWFSPDMPWQAGRRAPRIGEHTQQILGEADAPAPERPKPVAPAPTAPKVKPAPRGGALSGVRILDLTQLLATAGGTRILTGFGAEAIRVEWKNRPDLRYMAQPPAPEGTPPDVNKGGYFNDINAGRMSITLNMTKDKGKELFRKLLKVSDIIAEGYRPRSMENFGFSYDVMKSIKPDIVYVQQPGFGRTGPYEGYGSVGPVANAISGITEMAGLPEPYPPRGWLYSFMDFGGAYNTAMAMLSGLTYKRMTGKGIYIDSSQIEPGIHYTGPIMLDFQVNGRRYTRPGNRSPHLMAAPHGAYPCKGPANPGAQGAERWIAISCYTEEEWDALVKVMGGPAWAKEPAFATLEARYLNQDALDRHLGEWTLGFDAYDLMDRLQGAGIAAGVVQTVQEKLDRDPQLKHLGWVTELPHTVMGTYPVKNFTVKLSETPAYSGGVTERAAPCMGEDNEHVYGELLGLSREDMATLKSEDVI